MGFIKQFMLLNVFQNGRGLGQAVNKKSEIQKLKNVMPECPRSTFITEIQTLKKYCQFLNILLSIGKNPYKFICINLNLNLFVPCLVPQCSFNYCIINSLIKAFKIEQLLTICIQILHIYIAHQDQLALLIIQMEMRIKKRPSLSKINREKPMNMTMTSALFPSIEAKQPKLPPLRPNMRKTTIKFTQRKQMKQRIETQTTIIGSQMLQSYYQTFDKNWVKPSEYLKDIQQLNLMADGRVAVEDYEIKLSEKVDKNIAKMESLFVLMEKWTNILDKILGYIGTKKSSSPHLIEEVRFWRVLSKKFDELEYQFNESRFSQLLALMRSSLKTKPEEREKFERFIVLKNKLVTTTPLLKKIYLSLEEGASGSIQRFEESSDIVTSIQHLKRILLVFQMTAESNEILQSRMEIVYEKMNDAMIYKLTVAPLYPRELANISGVKQKYAIIDKALSFYSNFIAVLEVGSSQQFNPTLERAEHTRTVLINLLQIMGYFEYLYHKKQVLEFSKLFSQQFDYNIYDEGNCAQWRQYMDRVQFSMGSKNYEA